MQGLLHLKYAGIGLIRCRANTADAAHENWVKTHRVAVQGKSLKLQYASHAVGSLLSRVLLGDVFPHMLVASSLPSWFIDGTAI